MDQIFNTNIQDLNDFCTFNTRSMKPFMPIQRHLILIYGKHSMKEKILQKYAAHRNQIENLFQLLSQYPTETLRQQPAAGGWSALQVLEHLRLSEEKSLAYLRKKTALADTFETAGLGANIRFTLLKVLLAFPIKFKAPASVDVSDLPASANLEEAHKNYQNTLLEWETFLQNLPETLYDKAVYKHPRAGRLGWLQTIGFFQFHTNRHIKQIKKTTY
jgi:hypothetical protein